MAAFFIQRPIFAWVIAIVIMLAGIGAIQWLPLEQYPDIAPPRVSINATYTGAAADTIENSVTQVIEQYMKGIDNLTYMSASSTSSGTANISLTFDAGTDPDVAQMQVQNKLQQAMPRLPQIVQSQGVTVTKTGIDFLMFVSLVSDSPSVRAIDIGDYISSTLLDQISRLDGVGDVTTLGSGYAMRIWLDPARLQKYNLIPSDISAAIQAQNTEVSSGQLGALPAVKGQELNAPITARSKLQTVEQFQQIIVKSGQDGYVVRLSDVARVELGAESYTPVAKLNGKTSAAFGVKLASGANALATAQAVKDKLVELAPYFPPELKLSVQIPYDTTPFVRISIKEVVKSLVEAILLVVIIMYVFLQNLRATLIPTIAVPVVLLGTFGVLAAFGFSINTLTMFGLVLAIGLLVDDAIVVVENVERIMHEEGLSPKEATRKSMSEITSALVGISLVLSAVFIPMAFFGGATGVIYRQFSITIVSAMLLSVLIALTLTPALCATLLKPATPAHAPTGGLFGWFFRWFNPAFDTLAARYHATVAGILHRKTLTMAVYAGILALLAVLFMRLPSSFLPTEDQGTLMAQIQLPVGATDNRMQQVLKQIEQYLDSQNAVIDQYLTIAGLGQGGGGSQNTGRAFIRLKDWSLRGEGEDAASLADRATKALSKIRDAKLFVNQPAPVRGLGQGAGFTLELKDVGRLGHQALMDARNKFIQLAAQNPKLNRVRPSGLDDTPMFRLDIDDQKTGIYNLTTANINSTLSIAMGGTYVNDFINKGRVKKVYLQGDAPYRMQPEDIARWYVRNTSDEMVPFSAFSSTRWVAGSPLLERYNGISSVEIIGEAAKGISTGEAMRIAESIIRQLPSGIGYEWSAQSYQERLSGSQAPLLYAISVIFVFLCLAALYESWAVPFSVIMVVPLGILGAVMATSLRGLTADVYFQVGLLTTIGLSAKNAILIVEFAKYLQERGKPLLEATLEAVQLRLRPILMTSLAFVFGVLPLAFSEGAGAASRQAIGTGVLGGMLTATFLGIFFVPLFYVLIRTLFPYQPETVVAAGSNHE
ncbi:hydrophobic/amphiphilic exporter-1, HAE1 family/multidrug efflux pump [Methylophilus rhizosphaerae]|uniref:Efflux pump membrane transporter n=1 Tax=Methylophilus rhizosphaerae TaxID=492660 RepID=A0A1G9BR01_9PROT|nr:efflux RND transporter permease subunit [Methylophilus rhizosphaerae]SDK41584.1 hydrophobic/amphiphilic exporter-1, HAE1 family/multidrug efflux pump [Methylophilus rhizosphaerae]